MFVRTLAPRRLRHPRGGVEGRRRGVTLLAHPGRGADSARKIALEIKCAVKIFRSTVALYGGK